MTFREFVVLLFVVLFALMIIGPGVMVTDMPLHDLAYWLGAGLLGLGAVIGFRCASELGV